MKIQIKKGGHTSDDTVEACDVRSVPNTDFFCERTSSPVVGGSILCRVPNVRTDFVVGSKVQNNTFKHITCFSVARRIEVA